MTSKKQILVCGSINGQFSELFDKIKKVNKKSGPFAAVYCVGDFFVKGCEANWEKVKSNGCVIPLYIFGPHHSDLDIKQFSSKSDGELAPNVIHLGNRGILKSNGLKIAYLSGVDAELTEDPLFVKYSPDDVQFIRDNCVKNEDFKGVDLLLTYDWPSGVGTCETKNNLPNGDLPQGSDKLSWLSLHIRPQYIFCGKENLYYARRPYSINGSKYISAYNITPLDDIDHSQIIPNIFDAPFNRQLLEMDMVPSSRPGEKSQQFFYNMNPEQRGNKRKKNFDENKRKRGPAFDVNDCWFCLSSTNVEKHLVVAIGDDMYVVLAKGQLTEGHLIILPVGHHYSSLELPASAEIELEKFKKSLRAYFKSINKVPIFFERSFKSFHCQIHVIPIPDDILGIKPVFQDAAEAEGLEFLELPPNIPLKQVLKKKLIETPSGNKEVNPPFFFLEITDNCRMVIIIQNKFPLDFGRQVLASDDILNMSDRDSWKNCVVSKDEETALTMKFRNDFKPFNFIKDDDDDSD
ncbi:hypothetical protein WDU94_009490 [Cyamophila willieti]